jgi:hypothetical protein
MPDLLAIREADPSGHPHTWGLLMAKHGIATDGREVAALLRKYDAQVEVQP